MNWLQVQMFKFLFMKAYKIFENEWFPRRMFARLDFPTPDPPSITILGQGYLEYR